MVGIVCTHINEKQLELITVKDSKQIKQLKFWQILISRSLVSVTSRWGGGGSGLKVGFPQLLPIASPYPPHHHHHWQEQLNNFIVVCIVNCHHYDCSCQDHIILHDGLDLCHQDY